MLTSKVFALSLLLVSPLALARVQMHTQAELNNSPRYGNHKTDIVFSIDTNESLEIYNHDNVRVVAELLSEEESSCTIGFNISVQNADGQWEQIASPAVRSDYEQPSTVRMGSSEGDDFSIIVSAQKV